MRDSSAFGEFPCELLLNGVPMRSVRLRQNARSAGDLEVLVNEPVLGAYSLHSGFEIQLHEPDTGWRQVSVEELKRILKSRYLLPADDLPKASDIAECRLFARVDDIQIPCWERSRLAIRGPEEACVIRAANFLSCSNSALGIRYDVLSSECADGQDSAPASRISEECYFPVSSGGTTYKRHDSVGGARPR